MGKFCGCLSILFLDSGICVECFDGWEGQCVSCKSTLTRFDLNHNIEFIERIEHSLAEIDLFCQQCMEEEIFTSLSNLFGPDVANIVKAYLREPKGTYVCFREPTSGFA